MSASVDHRPGGSSEAVPLSSLVEEWVRAGLVTPEQGRRLAEHVPAAPAGGEVPVALPPTPRGPTAPSPTTLGTTPANLAIEALGYLGGVVVLVGAILVLNLYWEDFSSGTRAGVVGLACAALVAGGLATPLRLGDVGIRLRSVLWLAAVVALAGFLALLGDEVLDLSENDTFLMASAGTAAGAAALWWLHRHLPQQIATAVALMVTAAALVHQVAPEHDSLPGLGVWAVAVVWLLLAWAGLLGPRFLVMALAALAMVESSLMLFPADAGIVLALLTVTSVVVLAVVLADLLLLAVGALGTLNVLPAAVSEWFPDSSAVPFVLLGLGLVLVTVAVWTARRRQGRAAEVSYGRRHLPPNLAYAGVAAVVLAVTVVVTVAAV